MKMRGGHCLRARPNRNAIRWMGSSCLVKRSSMFLADGEWEATVVSRVDGVAKLRLARALEYLVRVPVMRG